MKKNILLWGTAVVLIIVAIFVTNKNSLSNTKTNQSTSATQSQITNRDSGLNQDNTILIDTKSRQQAIDFTLTDLNGNKVSLKDFKGKNVYINFWTTWCTWCKKEMPDIEKVYQEYKNKDLVILAINMGEDKNTADNFIKQSNYHFSVLLDSDQSIAQEYSINSIPVSIFIDKNGNIAQKRIGAISEDQMKSIINELIK
jgi:thiol-disulfide isomerase/thioredoxin